MADFNSIYLDTEVLERAAWPRESNELHILLVLSRMLSIRVFVPEGAELERRRHWMRDRESSVENIKKGLDDLSAWGMDRGHRFWWLPSPTSPEELLSQYHQLAAALKHKWQIETAPHTRRTVPELFDLATKRTFPFKEAGKGAIGFQDAVIYLSALDHLKTIGVSSAAFVTADRILRQADPELANTAGVDIHFFSTLADVIKRMKGRLAADVEQVWLLDVAIAEHFLQGDATQAILKSFLLAELRKHVNQLGAADEQITLSDVEIIRITNVQTPLPAARVNDKVVELSFDVDVRLRLYVSEIPKYIFGATKDANRRIGIKVQLEADAVWSNDKYSELSPTRLASELDLVSKQLAALRDLTGSVTCNAPLVRTIGFSELLGEIELRVWGVVHLAPRDFTQVDITVTLDTACSCRIDAHRVTSASLVSSKRGMLGWAKLDPNRENTVSFQNIPLVIDEARVDETFVIQGIRADCTAYNGRGNVVASIEVTTADVNRPQAALFSGNVAVGTVLEPVAFSAKPMTSPAQLTGQALSEQVVAFPLLVAFESLFGGAFKTREQEAGNGTSVADQGTVFFVSLSNVPKGFRAFMTENDLPTNRAQTFASAVSTDSKGLRTDNKPTLAEISWDGRPMVEITNLWRATWEVTNSEIGMATTKLSFGIVLVGSIEASFAILVSGGFGPFFAPSSAVPGVRTSTPTFPIPRFLNLNAPFEIEFLWTEDSRRVPSHKPN